jgi:hypothetical protein
MLYINESIKKVWIFGFQRINSKESVMAFQDNHSFKSL